MATRVSLLLVIFSPFFSFHEDFVLCFYYLCFVSYSKNLFFFREIGSVKSNCNDPCLLELILPMSNNTSIFVAHGKCHLFVKK